MRVGCFDAAEVLVFRVDELDEEVTDHGIPQQGLHALHEIAVIEGGAQAEVLGTAKRWSGPVRGRYSPMAPLITPCGVAQSWNRRSASR